MMAAAYSATVDRALATLTAHRILGHLQLIHGHFQHFTLSHVLLHLFHLLHHLAQRLGSRLAVALPPGVEPSIVVAEAGRIGQVELVDGGTEFLTVSSVVKTGLRAIPDRDVHEAVLTSADFEAAEAQLNDQGRPIIDFTLTPASVRASSRLTSPVNSIVPWRFVRGVRRMGQFTTRPSTVRQR